MRPASSFQAYQQPGGNVKRLIVLALAVLALGACEITPTEPWTFEVPVPKGDTCLGIGMTSDCAP